MTISDDFTSFGKFIGQKPEQLTEINLDRFVKEHGQEWVDGYLKAIEIVAIDLSNILMPYKDNPCGFSQTPHMVRTNLKKYWSDNKVLLEKMIAKNVSQSNRPKGTKSDL